MAEHLIWQNKAGLYYDDERDATYVAYTTRNPGIYPDLENVPRSEWFILPGTGNRDEVIALAQKHARDYPDVPVRVVRFTPPQDTSKTFSGEL